MTTRMFETAPYSMLCQCVTVELTPDQERLMDAWPEKSASIVKAAINQGQSRHVDGECPHCHATGIDTYNVLWAVMSHLCTQTQAYLHKNGLADLTAPSEDLIRAVFFNPNAISVAKAFGAHVREHVGEQSSQSFDWFLYPQLVDICDGRIGDSISDIGNGNAIDISRIFDQFDDAYSDGWSQKHNQLRVDAYAADVKAFIEHNKSLAIKPGDIIHIQSQNTQQEWLSGPVLYVHPEYHVVLIELPPKTSGGNPTVFMTGEGTTLFKIHREIPAA